MSRPQFFFTKGGEEKADLDSGATHSISTYRGDFLEITTRPTVSLTAVGGKVAGGECVGYTGRPKPNNLDLGEAVYILSIPIGRLLSTPHLLAAGWGVR